MQGSRNRNARCSARSTGRARLQGRIAGKPAPVAIIEHPDVKRMLLSMKARTEGMRALCYYAAFELDKAHRAADEAQREAALVRAELLIPVVKGWCTETGIEVTSTGVQVHGGMGYVEETGAAQSARCAHCLDLRGHHRHPGQRPDRSQAGRDRGAAMIRC